MNRADLTTLPHVNKWLGFVQGAIDIVETLGDGLDPEAKMRMLLEQNVILQLQHLKTHPTVAVALAKKAVKLHGWVYDIKTGEVMAYDDVTETWVPVEQRYAAELASAMLEKHTC